MTVGLVEDAMIRLGRGFGENSETRAIHSNAASISQVYRGQVGNERNNVLEGLAETLILADPTPASDDRRKMDWGVL